MTDWTWKEHLGFPRDASTIAIVACYAVATVVVVPAYCIEAAANGLMARIVRADANWGVFCI